MEAARVDRKSVRKADEVTRIWILKGFFYGPHLASADRLARTKACHTTKWTYVNQSHLPFAAESWQASYHNRRASYLWPQTNPLTKPLTKTSPCICSNVLEGISLKTTSPACQRYQTGGLLFEEQKGKEVLESISFKTTSSVCEPWFVSNELPHQSTWSNRKRNTNT